MNDSITSEATTFQLITKLVILNETQWSEESIMENDVYRTTMVRNDNPF